jgi:HSF-type DNA-binding
MIDQSDSDVIAWSSSGNSFTVLDVKRFETETLPNYFNHGNFSSFIRQLNFYGFQKLRSDPDLQKHTEHIRFAHECFRRGHPELLKKIHRTTAPKQTAELQENHVENLQQKVEMLQQKIKVLEASMEAKLEKTAFALKEGYMLRIRNLEDSYDMLRSRILQNFAFQTAAAGPWVTSTSSLSHSSNLIDFIRSNP